MATSVTTKSVINNFDYILYVGKNIKDSSKDLKELPALHSKLNSFIELGKENNLYSIVLSGLKFTRKLYEPGLIEAEVTIKPKEKSAPSFQDVEDLFAMRQVQLTVIDFQKNTDNETTIAQNYYIYMINPQIVPNTSGAMEMYVKLTIHSFDKLMAIDKYCKAFTAQKLSSEILTSEYPYFGLPANMVSAEIGNLQNLKYKHGDTDAEMIQPYLVQYNESFYDFLARTANRCGEFLYFEDGKLTLGLPTSTAEKIESFANVTMQGYTSGPIDVNYYNYDSVKDDATISGDLNYDVIEKDEAGFPKDTFKPYPQFNDSLACDEYIFPLENDKYNNLKRELGFRTKEETATTTALRLVTAVANHDEGNPLAMLAKDGVKAATDSVNAASIVDSSDDEVKKKLGKKWDNDSKKAEHYNDSRLVEFSSLDTQGWMTHDFYTKIRKQEAKQHKRIICIDMGAKYTPVKLGDKIQVSGLEGDYIVIQVNLIGNMMWQHNYRKFDPADQTTDRYTDRQSQVIYAIPVDGGMVVPPVGPMPMIRKAGPQTAYVIDNGDKKYQGRVRIAFPWQSTNDSKRLAMYAAEKEVKKAQQNETDIKKKLADIVAQKKSKSDLKKELEELREKSKGDPTQVIQELEAEKKKNEEEMDEKAYAVKEPVQGIKKNVSFKEYGDRCRYLKLQQRNKTIDEIIALLKNHGNVDNAIQDLTKQVTELESEKKKAKTEVGNAQTVVAEKAKVLAERAEGWNKEVGKAATPYIRVAMPMATTGGGAYFMPCKGDEVLVNFDNDNVERPYVVGSVYSKNTLAPGEDLDKYIKNYLQKKSSMTLMSPNGQHISFVAPSDGWKFWQGFSPFLKTLQLYAPSLKGEDLDWGGLKDLNGGIYMGDRYGMYELSLSSHDRKIKINSPFGNVEIGAFTGITINAPNGDIKIRGKNVSIEAGNKLTLHSGTNIKDSRSAKEAAKDLLKTAGKTVLDNTVGNMLSLKLVDMSIVRNLYEVFLRPIDGTLNLKSNNFVMLEAGKGKAQVPLDRYAPSYQAKLGVQDQVNQKIYAKIGAYIKLIDNKVSNLQKEYLKLKQVAFAKKAAYEKMMAACWDSNNNNQYPDIRASVWGINEETGENGFKKMAANFTGGTLSTCMDNITQANLKGEAGTFWKVPGHPRTNQVDTLKGYIVPVVEDYGLAIVRLHIKAKEIQTLFTDADKDKINQSVLNLVADNEGHLPEDADTSWIDGTFKDTIYNGNGNQISAFFGQWTGRYGSDQPITNNFMNSGDKNSKVDPLYDTLLTRRKMIAKFLYDLSQHANNNTGADPETHSKYFAVCYTSANATSTDFLKKSWSHVASFSGKAPGKKDAIWDGLCAFTEFIGLNKTLKSVVDLDAPYGGWAHQVWNDKNGQILFSSEKGTTYALDKGTMKKLDLYTLSTPKTIKDILKAIK
jgi:hypothetical protein